MTFKYNTSNSQDGFTLVEVIISLAVFMLLSIIISQVYFLIINQIIAYREQTTVSSLASQYLEAVRNMPYSRVGTINGNPHGSLADSVTPINITLNGVPYQVYYVINYIDDPADGTILASTDPAPNDYKQIKLYVKNTRTNSTNSFLTTIAPKGLEGLIAGGALSVKVFDAVGQPISGATIRITNTAIVPKIDLTRLSNASGNLIEVGLPNSDNSYHIAVTKSGYSADQTYPITEQNLNPVKPDSTISNGQVTQVSFSIDWVSNLIFNVQNQVCSSLSGITIGVKGTKLIGLPDLLKFNNTYVSNISGQVTLNNLEWDTYTPGLSSDNYMIYGTSPIQQISILPNISQSFSLILGPKTPYSLLVIVKDAATGNPIEGANVNLKTTNPDSSVQKLTNGSVWSQQDWSLGAGQENFINPQKYWADWGNIDASTIPLALRLANSNGIYSDSAVLTSSSFDTGASTTDYTSLEWQPASQHPEANIKFQIATNNDNTTWDYTGPDGTVNSYYTVSGTTINSINNNARYVRYKVFLSTTNTERTPVLTSVNVNYVSGCFTPGQAMFVSLLDGSNYSVVTSATGYQTKTIDAITISGYNVLTVLLTP